MLGMITTRKYLEALRNEDLRAIEAARVEVNRRLHGMNELRQQIEEERGTFLNKDEYNVRHALLETQIDTNHERVVSLEKALANLQGRLAILGGLTAIVSALITTGLYKLFS